MKLTIKPGHYAKIALHHKHVANTAKAVGDRETADRERRLAEVTLNRAREVRRQMRRGADE